MLSLRRCHTRLHRQMNGIACRKRRRRKSIVSMTQAPSFGGPLPQQSPQPCSVQNEPRTQALLGQKTPMEEGFVVSVTNSQLRDVEFMYVCINAHVCMY